MSFDGGFHVLVVVVVVVPVSWRPPEDPPDELPPPEPDDPPRDPVFPPAPGFAARAGFSATAAFVGTTTAGTISLVAGAGGTTVAETEVTYQRLDGREATAVAVSIWHTGADDLITNYRIFVDLAPVYAA